MADHNKLGEHGEQLAVEYLLSNGYEIKDKNWRFQKAEVDIIAQKGNVLAAVEVKTRSTDVFGDPQDFVDKKKIKLLIKAMDEYVCSKELNVEVRFDIMGIIKNKKAIKIEYLEDAFFHF